MSYEDGVYCSTSGTFFLDKDTLTEHYKSDFHRYNLKRKVAGLPPVTKEWFTARKEQLLKSASAAPKQSIWIEPLTKKKFQSKQTYDAFVESKKYRDIVKKTGKPAPEPKILKKNVTKPTVPESNHKIEDWETNSEGSATSHEANKVNEAEDMSEEWDPCRCLFDNHISESFEANLEYLFKNFGFFLPEPEQLKDPQGLLKYLGAKLLHGHIPLYKSGLDPNAKRFRSLHAVQRHMIDTNKWTMLLEGNEEEYEEYYDFSWSDDEDQGKDLAISRDVIAESAGYELAVRDSATGREKFLGTREFARYYKQNYKRMDSRPSVAAGLVVAKYRNLGISTSPQIPVSVQKARSSARRRMDNLRLKAELQSNKNNNLPRNVPY